MSTCPDENTILEYLDGTSSPKDRRAIEEHVDRCGLCAELLVELGIAAAHDESSSSEAAATMGRYVLGETLGRGGMGMVMRAWDTQLERDVAIKTLKHDWSEDTLTNDHLSRRLMREARALAKINHPNILTIHEVFEQDGELCLVTEYIDGERLDTWLEREAPTAARRLDVWLQVIEALAHAHSHGVIHRDIKPSNIMITRSEQRPIVIDFGLATAPERARSGAAPSAALTQRGSALGTPAFMSPEQHMGHAATPASDIFSVCASIYFSLYGVRPFGGTNARQIAMRAYSGELTPVDRARAPKKLLGVLIVGLSPAPEDRFESLSSLADALRAARQSGRSNSTPYILIAGLLGLVGAALFTTSHTTSTSTLIARTEPSLQATSQHHEPTTPPARAHQTESKDEGMTSATSAAHEQIDDALADAAKIKPPPRQQTRALTSSLTNNRATRAGEGGAHRLAGAAPSTHAANAEESKEDLRVRLFKEAQRAMDAGYLHNTKRCFELVAKYKRGFDSSIDIARGLCLMVSGACEAGEKLMSEGFQTTLTPELSKTNARTMAKQYCRPPEGTTEHFFWKIGRSSHYTYSTLSGSTCDAELRYLLETVKHAPNDLDQDATLALQDHLKRIAGCYKWRTQKTNCRLVDAVLLEAHKLETHLDARQLRARVDAEIERVYPSCRD